MAVSTDTGVQDPRLTPKPFRHPLVKKASNVSGWRKVLPILKCPRRLMDKHLDRMRQKIKDAKTLGLCAPDELDEMERLLVYMEAIFATRLSGQLVTLGDIEQPPKPRMRARVTTHDDTLQSM